MKKVCLLLLSFLLTIFSGSSFAQTAGKRYLLTADDKAQGNTVGLYQMGGTPTDPALKLVKTITTGGSGFARGGFFSSALVAISKHGDDFCAYVGEGGTNDIAGIDLNNGIAVSGRFKASRQDTAGLDGMGLVVADDYVYVSWSGNFTLTTFKILPGCQLQFVGDQDAVGRNIGAIHGMAVHENLLVVTYGDCSIESYDISGGMPVNNNDRELSTGCAHFDEPSAVTITSDGHYAIFGDIAGATANVEVSDISSGKLTPTVLHKVGPNTDVNTLALSPDETMIYLVDNLAGTVTAAFFDKATATFSHACTSPTLANFGLLWFYLGGIVEAQTTGTARDLFVTETGHKSGIAMLRVQTRGDQCQISEAGNSAMPDPRSPALVSITGFTGQ